MEWGNRHHYDIDSKATGLDASIWPIDMLTKNEPKRLFQSPVDITTIDRSNAHISTQVTIRQDCTRHR